MFWSFFDQLTLIKNLWRDFFFIALLRSCTWAEAPYTTEEVMATTLCFNTIGTGLTIHTVAPNTLLTVKGKVYPRPPSLHQTMSIYSSQFHLVFRWRCTWCTSPASWTGRTGRPQIQRTSLKVSQFSDFSLRLVITVGWQGFSTWKYGPSYLYM